jgi:hypothetical protein
VLTPQHCPSSGTGPDRIVSACSAACRCGEGQVARCQYTAELTRRR